MSGKLRIVLGVLVLAAAGSLVYLVPALTRVSPTDRTATAEDALTANSYLTDTDGDGLIDTDEVYWRTDIKNPDTDADGFLDGEEVLTGHNPLIAGPDDYLSPEQNATKRITGLTVGGLMAGDLDPSSPNYEASIKLLTDAMATEYGRTTTIPNDTLTIVEDSDKTKLEYARAMSSAFLNYIFPATNDTHAFFNTFRDVPFSNTSWITEKPSLYVAFSKEAHRLASLMESRALKVLAIPVPKSFEPQHVGVVHFLRAQQRYYEFLAAFKEDPILGSAALSGHLRLEYEEVQQLLYDFSQAFIVKFP